MSAGQAFALLCRQSALISQPARADLHVHTTHSDGTFSSTEVVRRARLARLRAVAVTDHDSLAAVPELRDAAREPFRPDPRHPGPVFPLEIISGVEITAEFQGRELHLLGYFVRPDDPALNDALALLREDRRGRLVEMTKRLRRSGVSIPEETLDGWLREASVSLGRRHVASYLVETGQVGTVNDAFRRYLHESGANVPMKRRMPVADAIAAVRQAGGVSSWAHPPADATRAQVLELGEMGLHALESEYPWPTKSRRQAVRALAKQAALAVTGGSDCHGPNPARRMVGTCGVSAEELQALRCLSVG